MKCLLSGAIRNESKCDPQKCRTCGWNAQVDFDLRQYRKQHGLTKGKDGLWRLKIKRKKGKK